MKLYSRTNVLCISKYPNFTRESKFLIKFWNDSTVDTPNFLYFIWAFNLINAAFQKRTCLLWAVYSAQVVILLSRIYVLFFVCLGIRSQFWGTEKAIREGVNGSRFKISRTEAICLIPRTHPDPRVLGKMWSSYGGATPAHNGPRNKREQTRKQTRRNSAKQTRYMNTG